MAKRKRVDKGRAVARFIASEAEIPKVQFDGSDNRIDLPYPYMAKVVTDRSLSRVNQYLAQLTDIGFVIRYDGDMQTVSDATVTMRLDTFVQLLKEHNKQYPKEGE
jgi:hypothetical protein